MVLDKKSFIIMKAKLVDFEDKREKTIQLSRAVIKLSKQIIYSMHRGEAKEAEKNIKEIEKKAKELERIKDYDRGLSSVAFQEYAEAIAYYEFLRNNKIPTDRELGIDVESYLMGLCDLTGELVRKAVDSAINKRYSEVERIRELVEEIYGEFLKLDLRNSELRKKADSIKWNLRKLEDLVLNIKGYKVE